MKKTKISKIILFLTLASLCIVTLCACSPFNLGGYDVDTDDIECLGYYVNTFDTEDGTDKTLRVLLSSPVPLTEYTLSISLTDENNETLNTYTKTCRTNVEKNTSFPVFFDFTDEEWATYKALKITFSAESTENPNEVTSNSDSRPRVTYMLGNTVWAKYATDIGTTPPMPDVPAVAGNFLVGWYTDSDLTAPYDFVSPISEDTTLYAKMSLNAADLVNEITTSKIQSAVTVSTTYYKGSFFNQTTAHSTSSGVIFKTDGNYTYILTNCHGVTLLDGYNSKSIKVIDYEGNEYSASVYGENAISAEYDLACLVVEDMPALPTIELAANQASVGETVISIGSPGGQANAITFGIARGYNTIKLDAEEYLSNVTFPVLSHTAYVKGGSSGGALLNSNLELVGINFAGAKSEEFSSGHAIPLEKIIEFLELYGLYS